MARIKRSAPKAVEVEESPPDPEPTSEQAKQRRLEMASAQVDSAVERIAERRKEEAKAQAEKQVRGRVAILTPKERTFLVNHLAGETQVKAAEIAGYAQPEKQGWRLAHSASIRAAMDEILTAQEMPKLKVISRLSQQAEAAYAPYLKAKHGRGYVDLEALIGDGLGHLIKGFKETQWGQAVEFYDAQTALIHMGRYHGLFTDNVNQSGEMTVKVKEPVMKKLTRLADLLGRAKQRRTGAAANSPESDEETT